MQQSLSPGCSNLDAAGWTGRARYVVACCSARFKSRPARRRCSRGLLEGEATAAAAVETRTLKAVLEALQRRAPTKPTLPRDMKLRSARTQGSPRSGPATFHCAAAEFWRSSHASAPPASIAGAAGARRVHDVKAGRGGAPRPRWLTGPRQRSAAAPATKAKRQSGATAVETGTLNRIEEVLQHCAPATLEQQRHLPAISAGPAKSSTGAREGLASGRLHHCLLTAARATTGA